MPTAAQCYAAYQKCLGPDPSPSQQISCTFAYTACMHGTLADMVQAHLATIAQATAPAKAPGKSVSKKTRRKSS